MLKAIVNYSKKVPAEKEFSSQGYSLSLETEIPESDPASIQLKLSETFQLVKTQVETELANGNGKPAAANGKGNPNARATNKQVSYMCNLAEDLGISVSDLNRNASELYGATSLYELKRSDATKIIDSLKTQRKAA